jgi:hypothetical protein
LPRLTVDEALDITRVYSVADALPPDEPLIRHRPFRAPHHTISYAGLIGGGRSRAATGGIRRRNAPALHLPRRAARRGVTMVSRYQKRISCPLREWTSHSRFPLDLSQDCHLRSPFIKVVEGITTRH